MSVALVNHYTQKPLAAFLPLQVIHLYILLQLKQSDGPDIMMFSSLDSPHFPKGGDVSCYRQRLLKSSAPERKYPQMRELLVHTEEEKKKKRKKNER